MQEWRLLAGKGLRMKLVRNVTISNFRSCRSLELSELGDFSVLTGLNNTGKSNILRALSLFFSGLVEPGVPLDLTRDYGGRPHRKQRIGVTATLEFPDYFGKNKRQSKLMESVGAHCTIKREWTRDKPQGTPVIEDSETGKHTDGAGEEILSLVRFRFIPAHRDPAQLLREEAPGISAEIVRLLKIYEKQHSSGASAPATGMLDHLRTVAANYIGEVSKELSHQVESVESVAIVTPGELEDFISLPGYLVKRTNEPPLAEVLQGSGVQSSLMFQMLARADASFSKYFGTKQGILWLVEEPECFLHTMLECDTARFFASAAHTPKQRLQVIATTHSDIMMQYADQGYIATCDTEGTNVEPQSGRALVAEAVKRGIARLDHVLLWKRNRPLVLVEGKNDKLCIRRAIELTGRQPSYDVEDLQGLTGQNKGGHDAVSKFLKECGQVLAARPLEAPIVYLADWDINSGKINDLNKVLQELHLSSSALQTEANHGNPELHHSKKSSFKGMEVFLPTRIIEEGKAKRWFDLAREDDGTKILPTEPLSAEAKCSLRQLFCKTALPEDCCFLERVLDQLDAKLAEGLRRLPPLHRPPGGVGEGGELAH